jgi:hypothetical protein
MGAPVYTWHPSNRERKYRAEDVTVYQTPAPVRGQ